VKDNRTQIELIELIGMIFLEIMPISSISSIEVDGFVKTENLVELR